LFNFLRRTEASGVGIVAPRVSVVMPAHNAARFLCVAIDSILAQADADLELVIVDDGSTDATAGLAVGYARRDRRVQFLAQPWQGTAVALNRGIAAAAGEYIARMDADDVALPTRFGRQCAFLDANPAVSVVGSFVELIDAAGRVGRTRVYPTNSSDIVRGFLSKNPLCHPSVMMRRSAVVAAGGYDPRYRSAQDLQLWLRMSAVHTFANIPAVLLQYREHPGQVTATSRRCDTSIYSTLAVLEHLFARHGLEPLCFTSAADLDFDGLARRMIALFPAVSDAAERRALYRQTARLLRYWSTRAGMHALASAAFRSALRDQNLSYVVRRAFYRFA
jgi:glycosyltransferase involved in cell wall biosynthesis